MKNNSYSQNLFKKLFGINLYVFLSVMLFAPCIFPQGSEEALSFDGFDGSAGEYIDIGNDPSLAITGDLTVELWFKIDAIPPSPGQTLVAFGAVDTPPGEQQENNTLYSISVNSSGQITAIHENGNGFDGANKSSATTISAGVWNYVAVVRDVAANNYKFYVNGKNEADNPHTYSGGDPNGGASSSGTIASFDTLSAVFFDGTIDEVRIWNVTRSLTEIRTNVCRKLTGAEGGLVAYYRMDGTSGTTVTDATGNGNTGTMVNMEPASDRVTSGAALGDDSNFLYTSNWTGQSVNLAHSDGDNLDVSNVAGSPPPDGVHIYRIDEPPNVTSASGNIVSLDLQRYWGVFAANGTSPTYDIVYDYTGHPGINNETTLDLARRADNSVTSWTETDAALDEANNTLTLTGESGTEYILGTESGENPLPITLTSFTARVRSGQVLLEWVTESEINNLGFEIWRSVDDTLHFELLTGYEDNPELRGAGNSNSKNYYNFADLSAKVGHQYYYTLWDVALSGERFRHTTLSVRLTPDSINVPGEGNPAVAGGFKLYQNYPNPFNPKTIIHFEIPNLSISGPNGLSTRLMITDILGRPVKTLVDEPLRPGSYQYTWDGTDSAGELMSSGTYIYMLFVKELNLRLSQKLVFLK